MYCVHNFCLGNYFNQTVERSGSGELIREILQETLFTRSVRHRETLYDTRFHTIYRFIYPIHVEHTATRQSNLYTFNRH